MIVLLAPFNVVFGTQKCHGQAAS